MTDIVHNEQVKLRASFLNNVAVALIAAGGFLLPAIQL